MNTRHTLTSPLCHLVAAYRADRWPGTHATPIASVQPGSSDHRPATTFVTAWDPEALYVHFSVRDRYVCTRYRHAQDPVCRDSCVEFFFSPGPTVEGGYFNLEISAAGVPLFHFQKAPRVDVRPIASGHIQKLSLTSSLKAPLQEEHDGPLDWTISARIPLEILAPYCDLLPPAPGRCWRGNFFKCADKSSHPHWLSWAPIETDKPQFHRPEAFGLLQFC